ncbi:MAG: YigZ family protein [Erysipelotrichaceae bacterium]|nr:YigZ family protein [Erysipelotrichaceae bacterium]
MRIRSEIVNEIQIKHSRFITYLQRVNDEEEAKEYIRSIKKLHPKANHHCYAFIITNDLQRSNDDNEPANTAGSPMLRVLKANDMEYICAVVVRYFGGILLGTGGLVKAYSNSVSIALNKAELLEQQTLHQYRLTFAYNYIDKIEYSLKDRIITDKTFDNEVIYRVLSKDNLHKQLNEITNGNIIIDQIEDKIIEVPTKKALLD